MVMCLKPGPLGAISVVVDILRPEARRCGSRSPVPSNLHSKQESTGQETPVIVRSTSIHHYRKLDIFRG